MKSRFRSLALFFLLPLSLWCQTATTAVRFRTSLGDIEVTLLPDAAPQTVANFLNYMNRGDYTNTLIHRAVTGFVIQGGGYTLRDNQLGTVKEDPAVPNEFNVSNTRGTIAMAKLGGDPNSATSQWFFNLANNSSPLDTDNGGYTVFGRVASNASLAVMDRIAALGPQDLSGFGLPFNEVPLINYAPGAVPVTSNFVLVSSIIPLVPNPSIASGGVITASNFGAYAGAAAPGSYIEIYGSFLAGSERQWGDADFNSGKAPIVLDNVTVLIGGQSAFVYSVSPTQINVQVPATVPISNSVPVLVTYRNQTSNARNIAIRQTQGGLLAPAVFKVGDKQFVAALHASSGAFVAPAGIQALPAAPAAPGETLTFYGVGFGALSSTDTPVAGQVATGTSSLANPVKFTIGDIDAPVSYAGLAPNAVGLYQFNVTVPNNAPNGDLPLRVTVGSTAIAQTLFIPVQAK